MWIALFMVAIGLGIAPASAGARLALVIGNADYANASDLPHAVRDAHDIAARFRKLGFEVHDGYDLSLSQLRQLATDVRLRVSEAEATDVILYYAGHGFSLNGADHLVPVDAALKDRQHLATEVLRLETMVDLLRPGEGGNMVVLYDACRDSPFPGDAVAAAGSTRPARASAVSDGVLMYFATSPGRPTRDGKGTQGPYARALLGALGAERLPVLTLLARVGRSVRDETNGEQVPVVQGALSAPFDFGVVGDATGPSGRPGS